MCGLNGSEEARWDGLVRAWIDIPMQQTGRGRSGRGFKLGILAAISGAPRASISMPPVLTIFWRVPHTLNRIPVVQDQIDRMTSRATPGSLGPCRHYWADLAARCGWGPDDAGPNSLDDEVAQQLSRMPARRQVPPSGTRAAARRRGNAAKPHTESRNDDCQKHGFGSCCAGA